MKQFFTKNKILLLILITILGGFLRFYKLDWGQGIFAHPDEYHIVGSVDQLSFPHQMNPHFFSYGTVIIYLIYFTEQFLKSISSIFNSEFLILNSFLIGRFYSALFSTLTILFVYKISRFFLDESFSLAASFLTAITPGLIQQAHFETPESALIFFLFGSLFFLLSFLKNKSKKNIILASVFFGFALGVKVSSIIFGVSIFLTIFLAYYKKRLKMIAAFLISIIFAALILFITNPYIFVDFSSFWGNLQYEGNLAAGNIQVFYTRQFIQTIPVIFQTEKIFPYTLGWPLFIAGTVGLFLSLYNVMLNLFQHLKRDEISKQVRNDSKEIVLLIIAFLSLFLPNAFLFAKWTRFMSPTFPFFPIFACIFIFFFSTKQKKLSKILFYFIAFTTLLWTWAFFSIYIRPDVRQTASVWIESNFPPQSSILVEGGNTIDLPLGGNFNRMSLDFYSLEDDHLEQEKVAEALFSNDYFFVQSRRVFLNHQRLPKLFPKTAKLYDELFSGKLGFSEIKEFHSYPTLEIGNWKLEIGDEGAEETWSVFDHPVIRIFKKTQNLPLQDYEKIF